MLRLKLPDATRLIYASFFLEEALTVRARLHGEMRCHFCSGSLYQKSPHKLARPLPPLAVIPLRRTPMCVRTFTQTNIDPPHPNLDPLQVSPVQAETGQPHWLFPTSDYVQRLEIAASRDRVCTTRSRGCFAGQHSTENGS